MIREESQGRHGSRRLREGLPLAVGIGASTGGPRALLTLLTDLLLPVSAYVFLVQHIHPKFIGILSRRLEEVSALPLQEAEDQAGIQPNRLYLAPGDRHMVVERVGPARYQTRLTDDPALHGVRPSVDILFASMAEAFGPRGIGVVLTGMGRDGLAGARAIKARGGVILAESPETCVVYGMPRVLAEAALVDHMVPIRDMAAAIRQTCMEMAGAPESRRLPVPK